MNRDRKRRYLPQLDSLEGRQLLAGGGSAGFARAMMAMRDAAGADAAEVSAHPMRKRNPMAARANRGGADAVSAPGVRKRDGMAARANRDGAAVKARLPKHRAAQKQPRGNFRRQLPPRFLAAQAPSPPPATLVISAPPVATASAPLALAPTEQAIIDLTNQQRMLNGLAPLATSGTLVQAARIHAGNMARLDRLSHVLEGVAQPDLFSRAQAAGYRFARVGENIAFRHPGAPEAVAGWMNSAAHRANMLDPGYTEIGVAVAANSRGELYYCQVFGKPA